MSLVELRTEAARELFDHTERLGYGAYDAARELMEKRGGGDWAEALALVEQEAIALAGKREEQLARFLEDEFGQACLDAGGMPTSAEWLDIAARAIRTVT